MKHILHLQKTAALFLLLLMGHSGFGQWIDTIEVIPASPTIHDSIEIRRVIGIQTIGTKESDSLYFSGDTIYSLSCFTDGTQQATRTFSDTFQIGKLPAGLYYINVTSYYSFFASCTPVDTAHKVQAFQVVDDIGLEEMTLGKGAVVQVFPNPAGDLQQINVKTITPENLEINLYDLSGRKVKAVYKGRSVQGEQSFEVDLGNLLPGIYFYQVHVGEETKHLRVIKQ